MATGGDRPERQRQGSAPTGNELTADEEERYKLARLRVIGLGLEFGFTTLGALAICIGGGIWLDRKFGTSPLLLLIGVVLAFLTVGYTLYQLATVKLGPSRAPKTPATTNAAPHPKAKTWDDWDEEERRDKDDDWPVRRRTDD